MKKLLALAVLAIVAAGCHQYTTNQATSSREGGDVPNSGVAQNGSPEARGTIPEQNPPTPAGQKGSKPDYIEGTPPKGNVKLPHVDIPPIPDSSEKNWDQNANITAESVAERADKVIASLASVTAKTTMLVDTPEGKGQGVAEIRIASPEKYDVEFFEMQNYEPFRSTYRADGKQLTLYSAFPESKTQSQLRTMNLGAVGKPKALGAGKLYDEWFKRFPGLVFGNLVQHQPTFTKLVDDMRSRPDVKVRVEKRDAPYQNRVVTVYRIVADGPHGQRIEMTFDAQIGLPVTIRTSEMRADKESKMLWSAAYVKGPLKPTSERKPNARTKGTFPESSGNPRS